MRIQISHESIYRYDQPTPLGLQQLRMTPLSNKSQKVEQWQTSVEGATKEVQFTDHNMNRVELISFLDHGETVRIKSSGVVTTTDSAGVFAQGREACPLWMFERSTELTEPGPLLRDLVASLTTGPTDALAQLHELSQAIAGAVEYRAGATHSGTTSEQALALGSGVCQDHSHVFIGGARLLGRPARYVSGYLVMDDRTEQEASHAWAEVSVPDLGWVGFDVSNGISPDERYVRVATGLDYSEAAPVSGIRFGSANEELDVTLQVQQ